jgi:hypothetical protein
MALRLWLEEQKQAYVLVVASNEPEPEVVLVWSWWRRYQQLRARRSHYKHRLALFSS